MSNTKYILGSFADPDEMMHGIDKLQANNISIYDCFTPMPIHGIEAKLGVKPSRLPIAAFLFGATGTILGFSLLFYTMAYDWPMNIGGKPNFTYMDNILAFIPITFEFTVLCAAHGMAITYLLRNKTLPGMPAQNPDPRTTDDKFVMEIRVSQNEKFSTEELETMSKETGIIELDQKEIK